MTSTNIYIPKQRPSFYINLSHSMEDKTPYTYLIGWSWLNTWYYGRRTGDSCHPSDLWVKYFTSSKYVKQFVKDNGNPDIIQIRRVFSSVNSCSKTEERVTGKIYTLTNWLNKTQANANWDTTGNVAVKDNNGNKFLISRDDPRWINGEVVSCRAGIVCVKNDLDEMFCVKTDDNRILTGELTHANVGKVGILDKEGNRFAVETSNPKYLSGEYVALCRTNGRNIIAYDKDNNRLKVSIDSNEWKSGNLKGIHTNKIPVQDRNGNKFRVSRDDPRWINGEVSALSKGRFNAKDKEGNIFSITKNDPRWINGELIGLKSNKW